jgi:peptidase E
MKLFLASTLCKVMDVFDKTFDRNKYSKNVMFIANPADPFKNKYWVKKDREAFLKYGYNIFDFDLRDKKEIQCSRFMWQNNIGIVHICGGSALYMMELLRKSNFDMLLSHYLIEESIIYTGTSAGSMIMGTDLSLCKVDEDEMEAGSVHTKNTNGLGFIPYFIMCHCQDKYYIPCTKKAIDLLPKNKVPLLFLNDNMAIWVDGKKIEYLHN